MTRSIAIVGSGIAGLGAAYHLRRDYNLTIFDGNGYAGGHTNTIDVTDRSNHGVAFDTGFMVFNHQTYPLLTALFDELGVVTKKTDMSFSVHDRASGIQWNGAGLDKIFAQRKNLLSPRFIMLLGQLDWFNKNACKHLTDAASAGLTLRDYVKRHKLSRDFVNLYLIPMGSSVWSTESKAMLDFPASSLIRFFHNHGFLGLDTHYQWYTVDGGARNYVSKIKASLKATDEIRLNQPVTGILDTGTGCIVKTDDGAYRFDKVIVAAHADQALALLSNPTDLQTRLLSPFRYQDNSITVHTDSSVMPTVRRAWASWNYRTEKDGTATTHYWMNNLQGLKAPDNYFVSLNARNIINPDCVLKTMSYTHPVFDLACASAQSELGKLNNRESNVFFCGSYFAYGFHEDAYRSACELAQFILTTDGHDPILSGGAVAYDKV